jgi:transcriptional regulator with XRE-family HTH domain
MSLAYADEAIRIRRLAPLTERDIARATGAGVSTVSAWLHRTRAPTGTRAERLVELSAIIDRLSALLDADYVPVWLYRSPTPADGRWQRGANIEGIYLAAEEATVWAEWYEPDVIYMSTLRGCPERDADHPGLVDHSLSPTWPSTGSSWTSCGDCFLAADQLRLSPVLELAGGIVPRGVSLPSLSWKWTVACPPLGLASGSPGRYSG